MLGVNTHYVIIQPRVQRRMQHSHLLLSRECHRIPSDNLSIRTGAPYRGVPVGEMQIMFAEFIAVKITLE